MGSMLPHASRSGRRATPRQTRFPPKIQNWIDSSSPSSTKSSTSLNVFTVRRQTIASFMSFSNPNTQASETCLAIPKHNHYRTLPPSFGVSALHPNVHSLSALGVPALPHNESGRGVIPVAPGVMPGVIPVDDPTVVANGVSVCFPFRPMLPFIVALYMFFASFAWSTLLPLTLLLLPLVVGLNEVV